MERLHTTPLQALFGFSICASDEPLDSATSVNVLSALELLMTKQPLLLARGIHAARPLQRNGPLTRAIVHTKAALRNSLVECSRDFRPSTIRPYCWSLHHRAYIEEKHLAAQLGNIEICEDGWCEIMSHPTTGDTTSVPSCTAVETCRGSSSPELA